jgi:CheY-like chemotaxis protein
MAACGGAMGQNSRAGGWKNGRSTAVSVLYAGSHPEQLDLAAPLLRQLDMQVTFAMDPARAIADVRRWQDLKDSGHEFANGILGDLGFSGELTNWTALAVESEIESGQEFLSTFFDGPASTFVYSGVLALHAQGQYSDYVEKHFDNGIHPGDGINGPNAHTAHVRSNRVNIYPHPVFGAMQEQGELQWIIIRFDKLLSGNSSRSILVHRLVLEALKRRKNQLWIAPVADVARELREIQGVVSPNDAGASSGIKPLLS